MQTTVADDPGPGSTYLWPRSFFDFLFSHKCIQLIIMLNPSPTRATFCTHKRSMHHHDATFKNDNF